MVYYLLLLSYTSTVIIDTVPHVERILLVWSGQHNGILNLTLLGATGSSSRASLSSSLWLFITILKWHWIIERSENKTTFKCSGQISTRASRAHAYWVPSNTLQTLEAGHLIELNESILLLRLLLGEKSSTKLLFFPSSSKKYKELLLGP